MEPFWGGYRIEFKVLDSPTFERLSGQLELARKQAQVFTSSQGRIFSIDISKFEYCKPKRFQDLDGFRIYVYTPEMIAIEKVRAICQQMPEYLAFVRSTFGAPRAQDFYDFYVIMEYFRIDLASAENIELLKCIFAAKRVPLSLIEHISIQSEFHRSDFDKVATTVRQNIKLKEFDFYVEYLVGRVLALKPLWIK